MTTKQYDGEVKLEHSLALVVSPGVQTMATVEADTASSKEMNVELADMCKDVRQQLNKLERNDIFARHRVAIKVKEVRDDEARYGKRRMDQLAEALQFDVKTLYRWAQVADVWPTKTALEGLLSKGSAQGSTITWSLVEMLAKVPTDEERNWLADKANQAHFTAREMRAATAQVSGRLDAAEHPAPISRSLQEMKKLSREVEKDQRKLSQLVNVVADKWRSPQARKTLERVRALNVRLVQEANAIIRRVDEALAEADEGDEDNDVIGNSDITNVGEAEG